MANKNITQNKLKELLDYDPETGGFTWLVSRGKARTGAIAGCLDSEGYTTICVANRIYKAHRLAFLYMTGEFPVDQCDHINHIKNDNRWENLRQADNSLNQRNQSIYNNNTSGCVGVIWYRSRSKWVSQIQFNGKRKHLGYFITYFAAVYARHVAEMKYGFHPNHGSERTL